MDIENEIVKTTGSFVCDAEVSFPSYLNEQFCNSMLLLVDDAGEPLTYDQLKDRLGIVIEYPDDANSECKKEIDTRNLALTGMMTHYVRWIELACLGKMLRGPVSGLARPGMSGKAGERKIVITDADMTDNIVRVMNETLQALMSLPGMIIKPELLGKTLEAKIPGIAARKSRAMVDYAIEHSLLSGVELKKDIFVKKNKKAA